MNKIRSMIFGFGVLCGFDAAAQQIISGNVYGLSGSFTEDTLIKSGFGVYTKEVDIDGTISIENNGVVESDIYVNSPYDLTVINNGSFTGNFYVDSDSEVIQIVGDEKSLTKLNVDRNYIVDIKSNDVLNLGTIFNTVGAANEIGISDSKIVLTDGVNENTANVHLGGNIVFYIEDFLSADMTPVMKNVSGNANVVFVDMGTDDLYAQTGVIHDGVLYISRARETDYVKIFDNEFGRYLNLLRDADEGDALLRALDAASDMDGINKIISRAARLNPIKLMNPVRDVMAMDKMSNVVMRGLGLAGDVTFGDGFDMYGAKINAGHHVGNLILGATAGIGTMAAEQDFDEYNAMIYSGKLSAQYDFENSVFVRGAFGGMISAFDIDNVFLDNKAVDNPNGYAVYSVVDMGLRRRVIDDVSANVFVGIDTENVYIENDSDNEINAHVGIGAGLDYDMGNVGYKYNVNAALYSDSDYGAEFNVSVWSVADSLGANAGAALINNDGRMSCKLSLGFNIGF